MTPYLAGRARAGADGEGRAGESAASVSISRSSNRPSHAAAERSRSAAFALMNSLCLSLSRKENVCFTDFMCCFRIALGLQTSYKGVANECQGNHP